MFLIRKLAQSFPVMLFASLAVAISASVANTPAYSPEKNGTRGQPYRMGVYKLANGHDQLSDRVAKFMPTFDDHMPPSVLHVILGTNIYAASRLPYIVISLDQKPFLIFDKRPGATVVLIADKWNELAGPHTVAQTDPSTLVVKDKSGAEVLRIHSINEANVSVKGVLEFGGVRTQITDDAIFGASVIERSSYLGNQVINLRSQRPPPLQVH